MKPARAASTSTMLGRAGPRITSGTTVTCTRAASSTSSREAQGSRATSIQLPGPLHGPDDQDLPQAVEIHGRFHDGFQHQAGLVLIHRDDGADLQVWREDA